MTHRCMGVNKRDERCGHMIKHNTYCSQHLEQGLELGKIHPWQKKTTAKTTTNKKAIKAENAKLRKINALLKERMKLSKILKHIHTPGMRTGVRMGTSTSPDTLFEKNTAKLIKLGVTYLKSWEY